VSPIGLVDIYPSVPRNTDPRAVPSRASAKRRSHLSADHSSLRRAAPPCLNQSSAEGEAWCHRSVSSISTHLCRETPIRVPFHRARAPNFAVTSRQITVAFGAAPPLCPTQSSAEGEAWYHRLVSSISTHLCRETPIRAPFHRVRAPIILVASRLTRISVGCHVRPRPVPPRHPPRERLGATDRSHQYSPIGIRYGSILSGSAGAHRLLVSAACYLSRKHLSLTIFDSTQAWRPARKKSVFIARSRPIRVMMHGPGPGPGRRE
jgi:hypothetical protein